MDAWDQYHRHIYSLTKEVHVWQISLQTERVLLTQDFESVLDINELSRARSFVAPLHRTCFLIAHRAVRFILAKYLSCDMEDVCYSYGCSGKPMLAMPGCAQDLRFNLSHSKDYALLAVASGREVGIDVEFICDKIEFDKMTSSVFCPHEITELSQIPEALRREAFFTCWTRKEAYLKALGVGLEKPLSQIDVLGTWGLSRKRFLASGPLSPNLQWTFFDLEVHSRFKACLVSEGNGFELKYFEY